jgi:hypothetical protein
MWHPVTRMSLWPSDENVIKTTNPFYVGCKFGDSIINELFLVARQRAKRNNLLDTVRLLRKFESMNGPFDY